MLQANRVPLEEAASSWLLETRTSEAVRKEAQGGSGDAWVGPEEASLWRPSRGPPCSPPLCHSVAERQLVSIGWLASGGPLEGHWCYVCREACISTRRWAELANDVIAARFSVHWHYHNQMPAVYNYIFHDTMIQGYPINIVLADLQMASRGQPPHGGQPILSHWVAQ